MSYGAMKTTPEENEMTTNKTPNLPPVASLKGHTDLRRYQGNNKTL